MLCVDCTEPVPGGIERCIYCAAERRASLIRKAGALIFILAIIALVLFRFQFSALTIFLGLSV